MRVERTKRGFTLIELLVVVAIIVILIAVLVPALTAALYTSTLTNCSANMDGYASSVTVYAHENRDSYPYRKALNAIDTATGQPVFTLNGADPLSKKVINAGGLMGLLKWAGDTGTTAVQGSTDFDDREMWGKLLDVNKSFIDPFAVPITLNHTASYDQDDLVMASYDILVGWGWSGEGVMQKLGSKTTYTSTTSGVSHRNNVRPPPVGTIMKWDLVLMDRDTQGNDFTRVSGNVSVTGVGSVNGGNVDVNPGLDYVSPAWMSHPEVRQHSGAGHRGDATNQEFAVEGAKNDDGDTSYWVTQYVNEGPRDNWMDRNFAHADGSVDTMKEVYAGRGMVPIRGQWAPAGNAEGEEFPAPYNHVSDDERVYVAPADRNRGSTTGSGNSYFDGTVLMPLR